MTIQNPEEFPHPQAKAEYEKYEKAENALTLLMDEIGELPTKDITPENSPFIAASYLTRIIEAEYLSPFFLDATTEAKADGIDYREWIMPTDRARIVAGNYQPILTETVRGNYKKLKEFIIKESEDSPGFNPKQHQIIRNLRTIAERMPLQGSPIKAPPPAWMKEPMPLREQLRQLQQGGGKS